jgi:hypothetical protein
MSLERHASHHGQSAHRYKFSIPGGAVVEANVLEEPEIFCRHIDVNGEGIWRFILFVS